MTLRPFSHPTVWALLGFVLAMDLAETHAQVGLRRTSEQAFDGYTLFAPLASTDTYLIDNDGLMVQQWESNYPPGASVYLLENGALLRTANPDDNEVISAGGEGGIVELFDWDGDLLWSFELNNKEARLHHDVQPLANGNILMIAWENRSVEEAIEAGRDTARITEGAVWPERIIEVDPTASIGEEIVWEWRLWDHLIQDYDSTKANYGVVADHPELVNLNVPNLGADWVHANAIDYNAELDQLLISTPSFNEIWIIDHSTTTEEAAGHTGGRSGRGGDLLYRWGNPAMHNSGTETDKKLFGQHDARWIEPGFLGQRNILIFNNGRLRPGPDFSSIVEITPPLNGDGIYELNGEQRFGPDTPTWEYVADPDTSFFSAFISGAHRLPNGNTLICEGNTGRFFEVDARGSIVWEYVNPVAAEGILPADAKPGQFRNAVFRATRYASDYPGFDGRDLTPLEPIELAPTASDFEVPSSGAGLALLGNYPNPFSTQTTIQFELEDAGAVSLTVFDLLGRVIQKPVDGRFLAVGRHGVVLTADDLAPGVYVYVIESRGSSASGRLVLSR